MIKHLEEKHRIFLEEERNLLKEQGSGKNTLESARDLAGQVKRFVMQCIDESEELPFIDERDRLLKIVDYWGKFVYQELDEFIPSNLKLSRIGLTKIGMTWEKLRSACLKRANNFLDNKIREGSFDPEKAVRRKKVEQNILQFIGSDHTAMVLTGEAGVGKTFLICQFARKSFEDETRLILAYDSLELKQRIRQLHSETGCLLSDVVENIIAFDLGYKDNATLENELDYLTHLLKINGAYLLICFDNVEGFENDNQTPEHLLVAINNLVERLTIEKVEMRRVKFMLTSLDSSWEWLGAEQLLSYPLYFTKEAVERRNAVRIAWVMEEFNEVEFTEAFERYTGKPFEGSDFNKVMDICERNPYLVRIAASLIREGKEVTRQAVFNVFYEERVRRGSWSERSQKERFLAKFIRNYDPNLDGVPAISLETDEPACTMLCLDGILTQEIEGEPFTQIILRVRPKGLVEHLQERFGGNN